MRIFEVVTVIALWGIPAKLITLPSGRQNSDRLSAVFQQAPSGGHIVAHGRNRHSTGEGTGIVVTLQSSSVAPQGHWRLDPRVRRPPAQPATRYDTNSAECSLNSRPARRRPSAAES